MKMNLLGGAAKLSRPSTISHPLPPWRAFFAAAALLCSTCGVAFAQGPTVYPSPGSSVSWTGAVPTPAPSPTPTPALSFTGGSVQPATGERGWDFTVNGPEIVSDLGVWDEGGDGLVGSHDVTIIDNNGNVVVGPVTVPSGTTAPLKDGFRYVPLATSV